MHTQDSAQREGHSDLVHHHAGRRVLAISAVVAIVLGTIGNCQYAHGELNLGQALNALYHTAQLFLLHSPHYHDPVPLALEIARWLAPFTTFAAVMVFARRMFREELVLRSMRRMRDHVVVCGLGRKGMALVRQLRSVTRKDRPGVVVIDQNPAPGRVVECAQLGALIVTGDATRASTLRDAGVARAAQVFAVCREDATNCQIAVEVAQLREQSGASQVDCFVHLETAELGGTLRQVLPAPLVAGGVRLHAVDAFDPEAISLLVEGLPIDHDGIPRGDTRRAHLIILGFGRMGRALAVRGAQLGQFANGQRLLISVIDRRAQANRDSLLFHHPQIGKAADLEFHELEALSPATRNLIERACVDPASHTSVVICFDDEALSLEISLRLLHVLDSPTARMAARMEHDGGLAHLVEKLRAGAPATGPASAEQQLALDRFARLRVFGTSLHFARLTDPGEWPLERFARKIHEVYVKLTLQKSRGDDAQIAELKRQPQMQDWDRLPHDLRDSNRLQAAHMFIKLRAIGLDIVADADPRPAVNLFGDEDAEMLARLEHDRWNAERWVAGWTYAEKKDVARRLNPNLVAWEALTPKTQEYDRDAVRNMPLRVADAGLKIVRRRDRA